MWQVFEAQMCNGAFAASTKRRKKKFKNIVEHEVPIVWKPETSVGVMSSWLVEFISRVQLQ